MTEDQRRKNLASERPAKAVPLRNRARVEGLPVRDNQPLRPLGESVPHGVTGNRFAFQLPSEAKGPIRAREVRKRKGIDGF